MIQHPRISSFLLGLALLSWMGAVWLPAGAQAQSRSVVLSGRNAQYVFIVDDSGSMAGPLGSGADPDRLAIFAVQSILQMLDDEDQATVIRLNGAMEGDPAPPLLGLGKARSELESLLGTKGRLAAYDGRNTPCRSALEEARKLLNQAFRPGVPQVVMFLTDGQCTPKNELLRDPKAYLASLRASDEDLFRFYLLRFRGRKYSRELEALARHSGGQALEVSGEEPTALVEPFADALTRAQGYEAEVVDPSASALASYAGARRVRLLAVARGDGPELGFELTGPGRHPRLRSLGTGRHRYGRGDVYRYAAAEYRPGGESVEVRVTGAQRDWKVVAVPEYRLSVELELHRGVCGERGSVLRHGIETGSNVCVVVSLMDGQGRPMPRADVEARVRWGHGTAQGELDELPAEPLSEPGRFGLQRQRLEPGDYVFQAVALLPLDRDDFVAELRGPKRSIQVSSMRIDPRPASLEFGEVLPGQEAPAQTLTFQGNFPSSPARLEVSQRRQLPPCVTFTLGGTSEGETLPVTVDQPYPLIARVAPYCGPQSFEKTFHNHLRLVLEDSSLPAVEIPVSLDLTYRLEVPSEPLTLRLRAGETGRVPLHLGGNQVRPLEMVVMLDEPDRRGSWPEEDELRLGLANPEGEGWVPPTSEQPFQASLGARTTDAVIQARADTCCPGGTYVTDVGLTPNLDEPYGGEPEPLILPLQLQVEPAGTWTCWWPRLRAALLILFVLLLLYYLLLMWRHSDFLRRERLADSLVPLVWDGFGTPEPAQQRKGDVLRMVRRDMPWWKRVLNWLQANPLVFGLPGGSYRESVELALQPQPNVSASRVRLVPERNLLDQVKQQPNSRARRIFASAQGGGVTFFGVPQKGRLGALVSESTEGGGGVWGDLGGSGASQTAEAPLQIHRFRGAEEWIRSTARHERQEGRAAGWKIG